MKRPIKVMHIIARLKTGISKEQAQANTNLVFRQILRGFIGPQPSQENMESIQHAWIDRRRFSK